MVPNSASDHHVWRLSSVILDDTLLNFAFTDSAFNVDAAVSVLQIKAGFIGIDELLPASTSVSFSTSPLYAGIDGFE